MTRSKFLALLSLMLLSLPAGAQAQDYSLSLKDHTFSPHELVIPPDEKIKIIIKNLDATPAEFESYDLNREKVIGAQSEITLYIGPLKAGNYSYFDDFHPDTTTGSITVK